MNRVTLEQPPLAPRAAGLGAVGPAGGPWRHPLLGLVFLLAFVGCASPRAPSGALLRVGTSGDYAPFSLDRDGHLTGLDIDIVSQLGRDLGRQPTFVLFRWPELSREIRTASFALAASGVTMRPERALIGRYGRPYAVVGAVALIRKTEKPAFMDVSALNDPAVRIAVNAGGHLEHIARQRFPLATIIPVADNTAVAPLVLDGSADAAVSDSAEATHWLTPNLRLIGPFTHDHKAFLFPAGNDALAAQVDAWMVAHEDNGFLPAERGRWLGGDARRNASEMTREAVAALINLRLGLMPAVGAAKRAASLPIEDPEQERRVLARVDAASPEPEPTEAVYRELIDLAKGIQRRTALEPVTAPLPELRDALARIDDQLVRELARVPETTAADWTAVLERTWTVPGLDPGATARLATALARPRMAG